MILAIVIILILLYIIYKPYLDIYKDRKEKYHILLWYNSVEERKFIIIKGGQ